MTISSEGASKGRPLAFIYDRAQADADGAVDRVSLRLRLSACRAVAYARGWEIAHWAADRGDQAASDYDLPALDTALRMMRRIADGRQRFLVVYDSTLLSEDATVRKHHMRRVRLHGGDVRTVVPMAPTEPSPGRG
jgi:hypothetical protein